MRHLKRFNESQYQNGVGDESMSPLPTAEEWLTSFGADADDMFYKQSVEEAMIEFAKLHVEACKKDIINNVETSLGGDGSPLFSVVSILKSYPLEKIK